MENTTPKVKKETKNKIRVEFDRAPLSERLKAKYLNGFFYKKILIAIFRFVLLLGLSYIILFPFFSKISSSFMSPTDFLQSDVKLIPKLFTFDTYKYIVIENHYIKALINTAILSLVCALIQTFICSFIGYGLAKFKFKGNGVIFLLVVFTMIVPPQMVASSYVQKFAYFDIFGLFKATGLYDALGMSTGLMNTFAPIIILSLTGLAFKNGLFIYILRQHFRGIPDELEESSQVDGYGPIKTFFYIILPISVPMLITVFILAFAWQWTDVFYTSTFLPTSDTLLLTSSNFWQKIPATLDNISNLAGGSVDTYKAAIRNAAGLLVIAPIIVMYLFCQRKLIQGIETSGFGGM